MRLPLTLLAGLALAACDFTPVLDIELPAHERALYFAGVVAADSTIRIGAGVSQDPYRYTDDEFTNPPVVTVVLRRDGRPDEALVPQLCEVYTGGDTPEELPCGEYASPSRLAPGETVQFVASSPGLPDAVATVTVPLPPQVTLGEVARVPGEGGGYYDVTDGYDVRFELADRGGAADFYGIAPVATYLRPDYSECNYGDECPEVAVTEPQRFRSSDALLLSAGRALPDDGFRFVAFDDHLFSGSTRSFRIETDGRYRSDPDEDPAPQHLRVVALSGPLFEAYSVSAFSLASDGENPFAEVADLPSNVEGGYGIVGALTFWEARLEAE